MAKHIHAHLDLLQMLRKLPHAQRPAAIGPADAATAVAGQLVMHLLGDVDLTAKVLEAMAERMEDISEGIALIFSSVHCSAISPSMEIGIGPKTEVEN